MKYLIDTHTFLWFGTDDPNLPAHTRAIIEKPGNEIGLSIASLWEIGIKVSLGKLAIGTNIVGLHAAAIDLNITVLPITAQAIQTVTQMSHHHRDPFDRIIGATALVEGMPLLSADTIFDKYGIPRVW